MLLHVYILLQLKYLHLIYRILHCSNLVGGLLIRYFHYVNRDNDKQIAKLKARV